jgi:hypothetical protein
MVFTCIGAILNRLANMKTFDCMKRLIACVLSFLFLIATDTYAQTNNGIISGSVTDGNNKPLEGATITLLKQNDSSIVKFAVASKTGKFELEKLADQSYIISVSSAGHETYSSGVLSINASQRKIALEPIRLQQASASLGAVTVVAKKPMVEFKADRTLVNVDASVTNVGATALEVLEKSPGVSVDRDGNISLKGKQGVLVMIDGKPSYLSPADLANMLGAMSANQLEQIEIMTNPPAKYDASGNSGVINIKTKKNKQKGFNGNIALNYGQGVYWKTNNSTNLNYRNKKFNVFFNYSNNIYRGFGDLHIKRTYLAPDEKTVIALFDQPSRMMHKGSHHSLKLGMDYSLSKKTTIGIVTSGFISPRNFDAISTGYLKNASEETDSIAHTISNTSSEWKNGTVNLNLRHQFDSSKELTVDFDYAGYKSASEQLFDNNILYPDHTIISADQLKGDLPSDIQIYSGKADYSQTFKKELKLEAGWKSSLVKTDNTADYSFKTTGAWQPDYEKTNRFLYEENINAAYANLNMPVKKWTFQAGLRYENTSYKGHQLGNAQKADSAFSKTYHSLFPTAYISFNADSNHTFRLNAGRRIDRPAYQQLNPFLFFINKFTYHAGNPFLAPQYTFNTEFSHTYKGILTTTLSYSKTKASFNQVFRTEGEVTILTDGNVGTVENYGIGMNAQLNPGKWWSASLNANVNYRVVDGFVNGASLNTEAANAQFNVNNQFKFNKGWSAELSGWYNTKDVDGQFAIDPFGQVSAGVSKQILDGKATIKLNVRDIFYTQVIDGRITYQNVREHFVQSRDSRVVNLGFTWRFGKAFKETKRDRGGASEEQNRVRAG